MDNYETNHEKDYIDFSNGVCTVFRVDELSLLLLGSPGNLTAYLTSERINSDGNEEFGMVEISFDLYDILHKHFESMEGHMQKDGAKQKKGDKPRL